MTAYTPELAIPEIDQAQNNKYITMNNALSFLGAAANKTLPSNTTGDWAITEAQFTRYMGFKSSGRSGSFNITLPDSVNISNAERIFVVWNADTTYTATVKAATSPGATVVLTPGQVGFLYRNGVNTYAFLIGTAGAAPASIYDIGVFVPGKPGAGAEVLRFKTPRAFTIAGNAAGSTGSVGTNPTSTAAFDIKKNGSSIGSISFNTSGVATFSTTAGASQSFAVNDILTIVAPGSQDATMADIGVVFLGSR